MSILVTLQNELKRFQEVQIPSYRLRPTKLGFTEVKTRDIFFKALPIQLFLQTRIWPPLSRNSHSKIAAPS